MPRAKVFFSIALDRKFSLNSSSDASEETESFLNYCIKQNYLLLVSQQTESFL